MITLYAAPGSCSICAQVVLDETGIGHVIEYVVLQGANSPLPAINPLGKVPTLVLEDGEVLTQSSVILPYLADLKPQSGLLPQRGRERRAALQWLGFFNSDVHPALKSIAGPERYSSDPDTLRRNYIKIVAAFFDTVELSLTNSCYLAGQFTIADMYACAAFGWAGKFGMPLDNFPHFTRLAGEFEARESVLRARAMELAFAQRAPTPV